VRTSTQMTASELGAVEPGPGGTRRSTDYISHRGAHAGQARAGFAMTAPFLVLFTAFFLAPFA